MGGAAKGLIPYYFLVRTKSRPPVLHTQCEPARLEEGADEQSLFGLIQRVQCPILASTPAQIFWRAAFRDYEALCVD